MQTSIVGFGDSTTAEREGVSTYIDQLKNRFSQRGVSIEFFNKGVRGDHTRSARKRFATDVLSLNPSVVIIQFGINDSTVDVWKTPPARVARVPVLQYRKNLSYFIETLQKQGRDVIVVTPNQLRWTEKLRGLYGEDPYDPESEIGFTIQLEEYVRAVREIAVTRNIDIADIYSAYGKWEMVHGRSCAALLLDGIHPNTAGHAIVANELDPILSRKLNILK